MTIKMNSDTDPSIIAERLYILAQTKVDGPRYILNYLMHHAANVRVALEIYDDSDKRAPDRPKVPSPPKDAGSDGQGKD